MASEFTTKIFAKALSWQLFERIIRIFSSVVIGIWIARYLGVASFGELSYVQSFIGLFVALATLGLDGLVVRELNKNQVSKEVLIGTSLALRFGGAIVMIGVVTFIAGSIRNDALLALIFIASLSYLFQSVFVLDYYFQSEMLGKVTAISNIVALIIMGALKIYGIQAEMPLPFFIWMFVLESLLIGLMYIFFYRKLGLQLIQLKVDFQCAKKLLKNSWPLIFSGFVMAIYMKIDQVMLNSMLDSTSVGVYAAAVRLCEAFNFFPVLVCSTIFPLVLQSKSSGMRAYSINLLNLHASLIWIALALSAFITLFGNQIILMLYGEEFSNASNVLLIYTWASVVVFYGVSSTMWIIAENLQRYKLIMDVTGAVLNVLLNFYLIPAHGAVGAAYATLISYSVTLFLVSFILKPLRSINIYFILALLRPFILIKNISLRSTRH